MRARRLCALLGAAVLATAATSFAYSTPSVAPELAPITDAAAVRILTKDGVGSGVSIGNGFIVTAAHVVGKDKAVKIKLRDGAGSDGEVLWSNTAYDIAMVRIGSRQQGAAIDCGAAHVGDDIVSVGNPLGIDFVTAFGRIAGDPREHGPWKSVYVTDATTIMGMSGGPVFSVDGKLIGITVGVAIAPVVVDGTAYPSVTGFGFVVPSSVVCELMGGRA